MHVNAPVLVCVCDCVFEGPNKIKNNDNDNNNNMGKIVRGGRFEIHGFFPWTTSTSMVNTDVFVNLKKSLL